MRKALLSLLMVPSMSFAQPYLELGLGANVGGCLYREGRVDTVMTGKPECSPSPLALVAIGYDFGKLRLQLEHWSSIMDNHDRGIEILSVRYRWTW